jgi:ADP-ribose pyrophosphatase YjhB (NUDIX family)
VFSCFRTRTRNRTRRVLAFSSTSTSTISLSTSTREAKTLWVNLSAERPKQYLPRQNLGTSLLVLAISGKLGMPGGFVDAYETAEASLHREVFEEVGITIEDLKFLMNYPNCYKYQGISCPVLDLFYLARASQSQVVSAAESEVSGWMWTEITPQVLERMAFESNRLALEQYLELGQS